jgi:hypothetical protein
MDNENEPRQVNSVDATVGHPIVERVVAHKLALQEKLASLSEDDRTTRADIDLALATIETLMTGDLGEVPRVVAADMSQWLERTKHLAG